MKFYGTKKAFTLAEVLITLGIIGVVAAMTIPTLMQKTHEKQTIVALKKAYSTLSNAYTLVVQENGTPDTWGFSSNDGSGDDAANIINKFAPYLKLIKNCGTDTGCFPNYGSSTNMNKTAGNVVIDSSGDIGKAQFADGSLLYNYHYGSPQVRGSSPALQKVYGEFFIDINGNKKPNALGNDVFAFYLTADGIIPMGTANEDSNGFSFRVDCNLSNSSNPLNGYGCTAWVLYNENMDYLHCNDLSWGGKLKCG